MITWKTQDPAVAPGGDVGGDWQAGEAWSVRLASNQIPGSLITVYAFAEAVRRDGEPTGTYHVQVMTEYLTCTDVSDPGSTETWSDYVYDGSGLGVYNDSEAADAAARDLAGKYAASPSAFGWDGQPFYHYENRPRPVRVQARA